MLPRAADLGLLELRGPRFETVQEPDSSGLLIVAFNIRSMLGNVPLCIVADLYA